jgi:hypothetical protein
MKLKLEEISNFRNKVLSLLSVQKIVLKRRVLFEESPDVGTKLLSLSSVQKGTSMRQLYPCYYYSSNGVRIVTPWELGRKDSLTMRYAESSTTTDGIL